MKYSHRQDTARLGALTCTQSGGKFSALATWTDDAGKSRKKTFKKGSEYEAMSAACVFMLKEGFILRAPQDGPIEWLTAVHEPYPHGFPIALDRSAGAVWLGMTGSIIRVEMGSCAQQAFAVGDEVMVRSVGCAADGRVVAVIDVEEGGAAAGSPPWRAPAKGKLAYGIVAIASGQLESLFEVPHAPSDPIFDGVSVSAGGRFLGPHAEGVGLYESDASLVRTFKAARTEHTSPKAALSPNGQWAALTAAGGTVQLIDLNDRDQRILQGEFSQIHALEVDDHGVVLVRGFRDPSWGGYRLSDDADPIQLFERMDGAIAPNGETVIEAMNDQIYVRGFITPEVRFPDPIAHAVLPALCSGKTGAVHVLDDHRVIVATRSHTLACIDLSKLPAA